jgi:hypothetical protein
MVAAKAQSPGMTEQSPNEQKLAASMSEARVRWVITSDILDCAARAARGSRLAPKTAPIVIGFFLGGDFQRIEYNPFERLDERFEGGFVLKNTKPTQNFD